MGTEQGPLGSPTLGFGLGGGEGAPQPQVVAQILMMEEELHLDL